MIAQSTVKVVEMVERITFFFFLIRDTFDKLRSLGKKLNQGYFLALFSYLKLYLNFIQKSQIRCLYSNSLSSFPNQQLFLHSHSQELAFLWIHLLMPETWDLSLAHALSWLCLLPLSLQISSITKSCQSDFKNISNLSSPHYFY